ncbi:helix-turn-helix domain-containing protein [Streptomyces sp. NPDC001228]|uniref:helix-turn-helix transcriptional regulator n=1 Tax=Streptomyces sp. NPDC001228 TaxID=3154381 RepID=UPI003332AECB
MARGVTDFNGSELQAHRMNLYARPGAAPMTAQDLAHAVGATKAQILAYENGHRVPDPPRLLALARALDIDPWLLMNPGDRDQWTLADYRRASGLRAHDVVEFLGVSPKNYRRFENEGIVPSRRPQFVDEVAAVVGVTRRVVEVAIDQTPAVRKRQARARELVVAMAERYLPRPGPWKGPALDDPQLVELAAAYGRPVQRLRRVLSYELGELRQSQVREMRERVIAYYDTDRGRQYNAHNAMDRWNEVFEAALARLPQRLERFHRSAQPSDVWQLLVDLYNVDASVRAENSTWVPTALLAKDPRTLPPSLVAQHTFDDVAVCRLTTPGISHIATFNGLYASLYPGARRPLRPTGNVRVRNSVTSPETFALPNRTERLAVPQPLLEKLRATATNTKTPVTRQLSWACELTIGTNSLTTTTVEPDTPETDDGPARH